jgi:UDP-N-acetylmuramyl pentapeptide phosphotransferase/UDP-N-acetylglucosamine-1-phosphate transferase
MLLRCGMTPAIRNRLSEAPAEPPFLMAAFFAPVIAFATSLVAVGWLARRGSFALDYPSHRSLHQSPLPRTGGLGLHAGMLLASMVIMPQLPLTFLAALLALVAISLAEDVRGISPAWRLIVHVASAAVFASAMVLQEKGLAVALVATLSIVWMINLYNFMDGSDGLAGGMALFGFFFYGIAALLAHATDFALLNFSIAAAAAAFLIFNFHPARIFMGDVGSVPLGFLAGSLGLLGTLHGYWPWWFPLLVFSPFIIDASTTLARRIVRRERIWEPHRDHYYQRLVQLGWGHRRTALAEYAAMVLCGGLALYALEASFQVQAWVLAFSAGSYAAAIAVIENVWRARARRPL